MRQTLQDPTLRLNAVAKLTLETVLDAFEEGIGARDCEQVLISSQIGNIGRQPWSFIGSAFDVKDIVQCLQGFAGSDPDEDNTGTGSSPGGSQLRQTLVAAYEEAQSEAAAALPTFSAAPADAPLSATIVRTVVPGSVSAGKPAFLQVVARNAGREAPIATANIDVPGGFPYIKTGYVGNSSRLRLTDENHDGMWSYGEQASALIEIQPPIMRSRAITVTYGFVSGGTLFSAGNKLTLNVVGPSKTITVSNLLTNGSMGYREDPTPARLTTKPWKNCGSRGCNVSGTERRTGGIYSPAVCWTTGDTTTNGDNSTSADDRYQYTSNRYYGVIYGGATRYVSYVWISPSQRDGLGLPPC